MSENPFQWLFTFVKAEYPAIAGEFYLYFIEDKMTAHQVCHKTQFVADVDNTIILPSNMTVFPSAAKVCHAIDL